MAREDIDELRRLYSEGSKHSNYQVLPDCLQQFIRSDDVYTVSRYEAERLRFIKSIVSFAGCTVLDVGGNTGFFSFEALEAGAARVDYYEGNPNHAAFVELASRMLNFDDRIEVRNKYLDFQNERPESTYDIGLVLNVLHHIGDDYGDPRLSVEKAREQIIDDLVGLSRSVRVLAFQLGYNWKGNRNLPLSATGTKQEMIEYLTSGIRGSWEVIRIGIAETDEQGVSYREPTKENITRDDSLGEFLNRPLFLMRSLSLG